MKINNIWRDYSGAVRVMSKRKKKFRAASHEPVKKDVIGDVARRLHPGKFDIKLVNIKNSTNNTKILRFEGKDIPYFRPGQFLTLEYNNGKNVITRPYSIISSPNSHKEYVEICVGYYPDSISGKYLFSNAKIGDHFICEMGLGEFTYNSIRDSKNIVGIAGGTGVTPFLSMARAIKDGIIDAKLTIIHGINDKNELILNDEFNELLSDKIKLIHVLNGKDDSWNEETGLINSEIIKKYSDDDSTYFICGSFDMYKYVLSELNKLNISKRRIRSEIYKKEKIESNIKHKLIVIRGIDEVTIDIYENESIASALERENIKIHICCNSGICGSCRIKVIEGEYYVPQYNDGRRNTDKEFGYVHACHCYPKSDLKIKINIEI